jgi:hypothetical protein
MLVPLIGASVMENQAATKPTTAIPPGSMRWGEDFRWRDTRPSANCCYPTGARRPVGLGPGSCRSRSLTDNADPFRVIRAFGGPPDASKTSVPPRLREIPTARHTDRPTSRASITITNTAALSTSTSTSTSTTLFPFRVIPWPTPARQSTL